MKYTVSCLLIFLHLSAFAQTRIVGFSESGEIFSQYSGGLIWDVKPDGTDFRVLKTFESNKKLRPFSRMVFGPDGNGYGLFEGYGFDSRVQVFYRYDIDSQSFTYLRVFKDSTCSATTLIGQDGMFYTCRRVAPHLLSLCKISLDGSQIIPVHTFESDGSAKEIYQTNAGALLVAVLNDAGGLSIYSGNADGTDWMQNLAIYAQQQLFDVSNIVERTNGDCWIMVANLTMANLQCIRFDPHTQGHTTHFSTNLWEFGLNPALAPGASGEVYCLATRSGAQKLYRLPTDNAPPVAIFTQADHGESRTPLIKSGDGAYYYLSTESNNLTQHIYLHKWMEQQPLQVLKSYHVSTQNYNNYGLLSTSATGNKLYWWKENEAEAVAELTGINADGTGTETLYSNQAGVLPGATTIVKLIKGVDGRYYGMTAKNKAEDNGMVFVMDTNGEAFQVLHHLPAPVLNTKNYQYHMASLFEGRDGWLYAAPGNGVICRMRPDGSGFMVIKDNLFPGSNIIEGNDGKLYWGTADLFRMNGDGSEQERVTSIASSFLAYDFCEIYQLPNGMIGGISSNTFDECESFAISRRFFTYDLANSLFNIKEETRITASTSVQGPEWILYGENGSIDFEHMVFTPTATQCSTMLLENSSSQVTDPEWINDEGNIYGCRRSVSANNGKWIPMIWTVAEGTCIEDLDWKPEMGYTGHFVFETTTSNATATSDVTPIDEAVFIAPNPAKGSSNLYLHSPQADALQLLVLDTQGRITFQIQTNVLAGENNIELPATAFACPGLYVVACHTKDGWRRQHLIIE